MQLVRGPVDYVLDAVGGDLLSPALAALKPAVHGEFTLEEALEAHVAVETRANRGKVVLHP